MDYVNRYIMMKYLFIPVLLLFFSCSPEEEVLFDMDLEADFTIPSGLSTIDTHIFVIRDVPTFIRNYITASGRNGVGKILPNRAEIRSRFDQYDFSIVSDVSIRVISNSDSRDKKEVFFQDRINFDEQNELRLFSSLSEVSDELLEDSFDMEVRLRFRAFTPREIEARLTMNFIANGIQ